MRVWYNPRQTSWNDNRYFILKTTFITFIVALDNCQFPAVLPPPSRNLITGGRGGEGEEAYRKLQSVPTILASIVAIVQ